METLAQMLEDYRNKERGLPSYDELMQVVERIEAIKDDRRYWQEQYMEVISSC